MRFTSLEIAKPADGAQHLGFLSKERLSYLSQCKHRQAQTFFLKLDKLFTAIRLKRPALPLKGRSAGLFLPHQDSGQAQTKDPL